MGKAAVEGARWMGAVWRGVHLLEAVVGQLHERLRVQVEGRRVAPPLVAHREHLAEPAEELLEDEGVVVGGHRRARAQPEVAVLCAQGEQLVLERVGVLLHACARHDAS